VAAGGVGLRMSGFAKRLLKIWLPGCWTNFAFKRRATVKTACKPIDPKHALIELAAATLRDAVLEDGHNPRAVVDMVMASFRVLCAETMQSS
jgi:hypothetical protein